MPAEKTRRRPIAVHTPAQDPIDCSICGQPILRNLARHETICNGYATERRRTFGTAQQQQNTGKRKHEISPPRAAAPDGFPDTADQLMDIDEPVDAGQAVTDVDNEYNINVPATVPLPPRFIYVKHHPHANKMPEFIPLDATSSEPQSASTLDARNTPLDDRPFKPFLTFADYKFASKCVKRGMPNREIDEDLRDMHDRVYSSDCFVTFKTHRDLETSLAAARVSDVPFHAKTLKIEFDGRDFPGPYEVEIEFRDPWSLMKDWICDPTLAPVSTWFSQEKFLCSRGVIEYSDPLYDEPWTGKTWQKIDDDLPDSGKFSACFLGLHVWLDKGKVSTKVKMHPILFRACWIHSTTRNGSGNGGSTLAGFVKMPEALRHVDPKTLKGTARREYDLLKRSIYRGVCRLVMAPLESRSHNGEALRFGDGVVRVAYPGILIQSMDFEELAAWLAIRNSRSLHPCPKCLVHKDNLPQLTRPRQRSQKLTICPRRVPERHFLWEFGHSDPYAAASYDCLHFFDGGVWGRHMWVVIKEHLQTSGLASDFNQNMSRFPRWRDLKHISSPTTIDFSEGQTFLDILKVFRVMQKIRIMLGLEVMTQTRLKRLRGLIAEYELICEEVSREHKKSFHFLKQHYLSHAIDTFESLGTSRNMNTRVGEGFQQEISIMDENEETMSRLDMQVEMWRCSQQEDDELDLIKTSQSESTAHWRLGSPESQITSHRLESLRDPLFHNFDFRLREYLARHHSSHLVSPEDDVKIEPCKVLYVEYQSLVDWRGARDILRCNPHYHGLPRLILCSAAIFRTGSRWIWPSYDHTAHLRGVPRHAPIVRFAKEPADRFSSLSSTSHEGYC
ncbi:hypothetical protein DFH09DRAFT_1451143 [Mycena vulgaris]|nr:hypothetical protein DFH09DRAFT_1451143 [Mycena vulgaris]